MLPPRSICIAASLFIAGGVGSIVGIIANAIQGVVNLDFGFLLLFVGYGLLIGNKVARIWAIIASSIGIVGFVVMCGWIAYQHATGEHPIVFPDAVPLFVALSFIVVGSIVIFAAMLMMRNRYWFQFSHADRASCRSFAWSIAVVSAALFITLNVNDWWREQESRVPVNTRVILSSAVPDNPLPNHSIQMTGVPGQGGVPAVRFRVSHAIEAGEDAVKLHFEGVTFEPIALTLHADGFEDEQVVLDADSGEELKVKMQPLAKR